MSARHDMAVSVPIPSPHHGHAASGWYPVTSTMSPIGMQALEIINSILDDPSPGLADVKLRLRGCLAKHPRHPEQALRDHLLETSRRANSKSGPQLV